MFRELKENTYRQNTSSNTVQDYFKVYLFISQLNDRFMNHK